MEKNHETRRKDDDEDSIISDRCWEEKYKGDSHRWFMRDGRSPNSMLGYCSNMRDTLQAPQPIDRPNKGIRRQQLEEKWREEVAHEIIKEQSEPPPVEEYCTEYDGNFNYPGYDPNKEVPRNDELYLKYPLYGGCEATTYWKQQVDLQQKGAISMPGFTALLDMKSPFKKNSEFSKRIDEVLDQAML